MNVSHITEIPVISASRQHHGVDVSSSTNAMPETTATDSVVSIPANSLGNESLHFKLHKETGQLIAEVTDSTTGKVIRTMPPEEVIETLTKFNPAVGMLVNKEG